ncbi:MAG TPA: TSUP family transporter [Candidatus Limnocylindria bacterium]|jgi:uncharacterized membrane protein YfcA|nr:TSUP family transporter [Candidatus Limnocylindria bacterium]
MHFPWWLYPLLFATGLGAGFIDAIAGGGGLITVPVLLATGLPPQIAIATNRFQSSFGTAIATWSYHRAGLLAWRTLWLGVGFTALGAVAGAFALKHADATWLKRLIPFLLLGIAALLWFKPDLGGRPHPARWPATVFAVVFGLVLGFYDGFFGPGTGTFWTLACVLLLGLDLRAATAHTKVMNLTSNVASVVVYLAAGLVRFDLGLTMAAGQLIGGRLGSRVVVKGGAKAVRPVLLTVVLTLTAKLLWDNFHH